MKAPPPREPSAVERLAAWARANAVFFAKDTTFANPGRAREKLKHLAGLTKNAGMLLRIVGFTDEQGVISRNSSLSLARADKVRAILISQGARASLLVAVGRKNAEELSSSVGERSPNRRVQFELGFIGEQTR